MATTDRWPRTLWLVRHGESAGNVARDLAEAEGRPVVDVVQRDMDVPLSTVGGQQAQAVGEWLADLPDRDRPSHTLASPYVRAQQTATIALEAAGCSHVNVRVDERLREREFGILDRLTREGIAERFPEQAAARAFLGKFYHRPPGGESWADVALRLRSVLDTIGREYAGERLMIVTHQVVILVFRYLLEQLTEEQVLAIDRSSDVANCAVTIYDADPDAGPHGGMKLRVYNDVSPVRRSGERVTREADAQVAPR